MDLRRVSFVDMELTGKSFRHVTIESADLITAPGFNTAYFRRPAELVEELCEAGLAEAQVPGIEGIGGWLPAQPERIANPDRHALSLMVAALTESELELAGPSGHLPGVGRKGRSESRQAP